MSVNPKVYHKAPQHASDAGLYQGALRILFYLKGEYLMETVYDWYKKTDSLKDVFHILMQHSRVDKTKPCVEWYKNNDEMMCMVKLVSSERKMQY
jgi:hypothetical protein